jgi:hypothetical protein
LSEGQEGERHLWDISFDHRWSAGKKSSSLQRDGRFCVVFYGMRRLDWLLRSRCFRNKCISNPKSRSLSHGNDPIRYHLIASSI